MKRVRISLVAAFGLALVLAACRTHSPSPKAPSSRGMPSSGHIPEARRWLAADAKRARAAGAAEMTVVAVDAAAPGDRVGGMVTIPKEQCALILARGSETVGDIDLFAYADDGTLLGSDEAPDKDASMLICPPHPKHAYVVARVAAGQGIVAVSGQVVQPTDAERVGTAVNARGRPGEMAKTAAAWPGLDDKVLERRSELGSSWQDVRRVALPVEPRMPTRLSVVIEENRCLDVLAVPSEEVAHLDLTLVDSGGRIIGRGEARGRDRSAIVCSAAPAPITLEVRPHAGAGLVALVLSKTVESKAGTDLHAAIVRHDVAPVADLETARKRHASRLEQLGYGPARLVNSGDAVVAKRSSAVLDLPGGCSRLDIIAGRPARGVEGWLWTSEGALVAHGEGTATATLYACGTARGARLDVEAVTNAGPIAVELRSAATVPSVLGVYPLAAGRVLARMASRGEERFDLVDDAKVLDLVPTHGIREHLEVPSARCLDVALALGQGGAGAEIRLVDEDDGEELGLARGPHSVAMTACAPQRGKALRVRAELRAATGSTRAIFATRSRSPKP